jgi:hypothetical protein
MVKDIGLCTSDIYDRKGMGDMVIFPIRKWWNPWYPFRVRQYVRGNGKVWYEVEKRTLNYHGDFSTWVFFEQFDKQVDACDRAIYLQAEDKRLQEANKLTVRTIKCKS